MDTDTNLRREERVKAVLPVLFMGGRGTTKNVSASGLYIETDFPLQVGREIEFTIEFDHHAGGPLQVKCAGRILRIDADGNRCGIAASIRWPD